MVCLQEVLTWYHLRLLARHLPSFPFACYRPAPAGPAAGLVTLSRTRARPAGFRRFGAPAGAAGLPRLAGLRALRKGALLTRLRRPALSIINAHLISNADGDWSAANRFRPVHAAQLAALARAVAATPAPAVACGDFNIPRHCALIGDFLAATGLEDAFGGACPPTFRLEFLPPGATGHAVDLILVTAGITVEDAGLLLPGKAALPGGPAFASDHVGLRAGLAVPPEG